MRPQTIYSLLISMITVVSLLSGCGMYRQALQTAIDDSVEEIESQLAMLDDSSSLIDGSVSSKSNTLVKTKDYATAEQLWISELDKFKDAKTNQEKTAKALVQYQIARMEMHEGKNEKAESDFKEIFAALEAIEPQPKHPLGAVATSYSSLLRKLGRLEESKEWQSKARSFSAKKE